jgi:hypothetical protein
MWSTVDPTATLKFSYNFIWICSHLDKSMFERIFYEVDKSEIPQ